MLFLALHSLCLALVDLQAGGGGSFGGGGGGGGGFSGGGGGGGDGGGVLVYLLFRLVFEKPLIGVPLLIVAVVVLAKSKGVELRSRQNRAIRKTRTQRRKRTSNVTAAALQAADPEFELAPFFARVEVAFHKAQDAWCAQNLESIRAFVSDGVFERFSLQIEQQRVEGWQQRMQGTALQALSLAHIDTTGIYETITVRIPFNSSIDRISLEGGRAISGTMLRRNHFEECWTFVRRRGARTRSEAGLIEGQCPNCGAPLGVNQSAKCGTCEAFVRSGEFDWVLTEITQASEWRPEDAIEIAGLQSFLQRDPNLSPQLLEDRTSVAFWRIAAAQFHGDTSPLVRVVDEAFAERFAENFSSYGESKRVYTADHAVGSVRTLGLLAGEERDRALVEVVWDGRRARVDEDGKRRLEKQRMLRTTLFVFARKAGSTTSDKDTFSTTICRTCGAHDAGGTDPRCPYCESPRTGNASTWLLTESVQRGTPEAKSLLAELAAADAAGYAASEANVPSPAGLFAWAVALVRSDGEIDQRERRALDALAKRLDLEEVVVERALENTSGAAPAAHSPVVGRRWLSALIELALDDGKLSGVETMFLRDAANALGIRRKELQREIDSQRTELYTQARAARKDDAGE